MPIFIYEAKDKAGKKIKGEIEAKDSKLAISIIKERGYFPFLLKEKKESELAILWRHLTERISSNDVVTFTRQLAVMINAGVSLIQALNILKNQRKKIFADCIAGILREVSEGSSLANALAKYPKIFSQVYVSLVRAGETGGVLDNVLNRLADNLESQRSFKSKIKGAMIYPVIIIIGMVGVAIVMMVFVIPKLLGLYKEIGAELPVTTRVLISLSDFSVKFWWVFLIILGVVGYLFRLLLSNPEGREKIDKMRLKIPIFGRLTQNMIATDFTRTLGLLVGVGVPILEALEVVSQTSSNVAIQKEILRLKGEVRKGTPLSKAMSQGDFFPSVVPEMVAVGEETGKINEILMKVADFFQAETEESLKKLSTAIEPLIIIILGVGVGFLVVSVLMPMYSLTSQIK